MAEIETGVELTLKDKFSKGIGKASTSTEKFASGARSALGGIDKALSGTASKLGALGLSFGVGMAVKELMDVDTRLVEMGVNAGLTSQEINSLKQKIYEVSTLPDIKIDLNELLDSLGEISDRTGDMEFAAQNLEAMGLAIRGAGASGSDIGGLYAEFNKAGMSAKEAAEAIDTLYKQGTKGSFPLEKLAALGPRAYSSYVVAGREAVEASKEMGAALQIMMAATGGEDTAVSAFEALMANLTSPDKQEKLKALGVVVRDEFGNFRAITDIMEEVVIATDGSIEEIAQIFDETAKRGFQGLTGEWLKLGRIDSIDGYMEGLEDSTSIADAAAQKADTLAASLTVLNTSFIRFADSTLSKPLEKLADVLNDLTEDPEQLQTYFKYLAAGLTAVAAVKIGVGTASLLSNLKNIKSGGKSGIGSAPSVSGLGGMGQTPLPVFVTNMGVGGLGTSNKSSSSSGKSSWSGALTNALKSAGFAMLITAAQEIPNAIREWNAIDENENLTEDEKKVEQGGAAGDATGTIVGTGLGVAGGALLGAKAGAILGSVVPGIGNIVGLVAGGLIGGIGGFFGGKAGRAIGEKIAEAPIAGTNIPHEYAERAEHYSVQGKDYTRQVFLGDEKKTGGIIGENTAEAPIAGTNIPREYIERVERYSIPGKSYERQPQPSLKVDTTFTDQRTIVEMSYGNSHVSNSYPNGSAKEARNTM